MMTSASLAVTDDVEWSGAERRGRASNPGPWSDAWTAGSRFALIAADVLAVIIASAIVLLLRHLVFGPVPAPRWGYTTGLFLWFAVRAATSLYRPFGLYPPEELRRSFFSSASAMVLHFSVLSVVSDLEAWRLVNLVIWPFALLFTYALRTTARSILSGRGAYGIPIVVIGNGAAARHAIRELHAHPELGFVPVAVFSSEYADASERRKLLGVPVVGRAEEAAAYRFPYLVSDAMIAVGDGWQDERNQSLAKRVAARYPNLQIFSAMTGHGHCLARARPLGPYLIIETSHSRFTRSKKLLKRLLDIAVAFPVLLISLPLLLIAGVAIMALDPGPMLFSQVREGRRGQPIRIYKLRSMVVGAEARLASYLTENPAARFEYERTMKLRNDPRIIPVVGKLIRKSSLDEVPQLWSVLKGDMSLVGPRVMPTREISLYSETGQELRRDMKPGLTGFWQVEHRSDSDFSVREIADSFYVANWSIWLDLWIILRTVRVVLTGSGAF
jgi:Undecaprenyl-phosphate galactose phosphotransferase WbaP